MLHTRALGLATALVLLAGCTPSAPSATGGAGTTGASGASTGATGTAASTAGTASALPSVPIVVGSADPSAAASPSASKTPTLPTDAAQALLARHGLAGKSVEEVIAALEASPDERPLTLKAVVKPAVLELSDGGTSGQLPLPADRFYVALGPTGNGKASCDTVHDLSRDTGDLAGQTVHVVINAANNSPLVDADVTLGPNGFAGFWVPRGQKGLITVTKDGRTGQTDYVASLTGPTCRAPIYLG